MAITLKTGKDVNERKFLHRFEQILTQIPADIFYENSKTKFQFKIEL